ncbi:MAG: type IV pilin protein [Steroidobacteraceae bacterium]
MTSHTMRHWTRSAGFTLVELMIVVVIVAILAAVALPMYNQQIRESRRTEAKTAVLELASREEKYFSVANSYTTDPTQLGYSAAAGATFPQSTGEYYQITVEVPDPGWAGPATSPSYLITATPAAGSPQLADTQCTSFSVTQTGVQSETGTLGSDCWN